MGVYCAMFGCTPNNESKHRFPNPSKFPELFQNWIIICGNTNLLHKSPESVYSGFRVCRKHFTEGCFGRNNILIKTAVPTLYLPEPLKMSLLPLLRKAQTTNIETEERLPHIQSIADVSEAIPSTSRDSARHDLYASQLSVPSTSKQSFDLDMETPKKGQRENILSSIGKHKTAELSPKTKYLYTKVCRYKRKWASAKRSHQTLKRKLVMRDTKKRLLPQSNSSLDRIKERFFQSQVENMNKQPTGHRYTLDDKVLALALQKQSGSGYKFLSHIFNLPSKRTIQRMLERVDVKPGINHASFELFKSMKFKMNLDKYCILLFDEMSIAPHLQYNAKDDIVEGFEDFGYKKTNKIANHVQVFMLRGILHKWKQPVYYNAVNGATKSTDIVRIIKLIVAEAKDCGLVIVATVCDQGTNNVAAIKSLTEQTHMQNTREGIDCSDCIFKILDMNIVPLFDTPHLLKGLRNNLLKNDLCFEINSEKKIAKWDHIYTAYKMDPYIGNVRSMPRLTDYHVNPLLIKKMKVTCCTQVFSNSVARAINLMAFSGTAVTLGNETLQLPKNAMQTADLCEFLDLLFDSLNGSSVISTKQWRKGVTKDSGHIQFWNHCLKVLSSMYFVSNTGQILRKPPSLTNFITTITNFKVLFDMLSKVGFERMMPRTFNQDPLENFFGKIRQRSYRYTNPTISSFHSLYKSLLVNNLTGKHSIEGNCEDDNSSMFFTLKNLVTQNQPQAEQIVVEAFSVPPYIVRTNAFLKQILCYMGGYISRKIKICNTCATCRNNLLTDETREIHQYTVSKEFRQTRSLFYMNEKMVNTITKCYYLVLFLLHNHIHEISIRKRIIATLFEKVQFKLHCSEHGKRVKLQIFDILTKTLIHNYIKQVNNVMSGKDLRKLAESDPQVFHNARSIYLKRKRK